MMSGHAAIAANKEGVPLGPRNPDEARFLALSDDGFFEYDPQGGKIWLSPQWKALIGFAPEELPDTVETWRACSVDDDFDSAMRSLASVLSGGLDRVTFRQRLLTKDGRVRQFLVRVSSRESAGRRIVTGMFTDIPEESRRDRLSERDLQLSRIERNRQLMICRLTPDLRIVGANEAYAWRVGMTLEELDGISMSDFVPQSVLDMILADFRLLSLSNPVVVRVHETTDGADGSVWEEWICAGRFDDAGRLVEIDTFGRNITEARRAEIRFREAIENLPMAVRMYDEDDRLVLWNQKYEEYFPFLGERSDINGLTYEQILRLGAERGAFPGYNEADDKEAWIANRIAEHREADRPPFERELGDGRHVRFSEYRTLGGYNIGLREDVTERRKAEMLLEEAIEQIPGAVSRYDAQDRLILCNSGFRKVFTDCGIYDEIIGKTYHDLLNLRFRAGIFVPDPGESIESWLDRRVAQHRMGDGLPEEIRQSNGVWYQLRKLRTSDGGIIAISIDITGRKEIEQTLRDAIEQLPGAFGKFDAEDRLVICNSGFRRMFDSENFSPVGKTYRDLSRWLLDRDMFGIFRTEEKKEAWYRRRIEIHDRADGSPHEFQLSDGSWHQLRENRTADGGICGIRIDVTNEKRAAARLENAIDSLTSVFTLHDADDRLVLYNNRLFDMFPVFREQNISPDGLTYREIAAIALESGSILPPESRMQQGAALDRLVERHLNPTGEPFDVQFEDGRWFRVVEHRTAEGGVVGIRTEITAEKLAEQRLQGAIANIPGGFTLFDAEDRLVLWNDRFPALYDFLGNDEDLTGITYEQILRRGYACGSFELPEGKSVDDAIAEFMELHRAPHSEPVERGFSDGRTISVTETLTEAGEVIGIRSDVTELRRARRQLQDAIDALPEGFALYDADDRLVAFNDRYVEFYELAPDDLGGTTTFRDVLEMIVHREIIAIGGQDPDEWIADRMAHHRAPNEPIDREMNSGRWLRISEKLTSDGGVVAVVSDITELKNSEQRLSVLYEQAETSRALLDEAIEAITEGFIYYDRDGRLLVVNDRHKAMFPHLADILVPGVSRVDVLRRHFSVYPRAGAEPDFDRFLAEESERRKTPRGMLEYRNDDGRWLHLTEAETSTGGIVSVRTDITGLKEKEEQLVRTVSDLETAQKNLEEQAGRLSELAEDYRRQKEIADEANRAKSDFLATMSHEIRTPMNGVLGMAELLLETRLTAQQREFGETILGSGRALLTILNDILDLSRLEAGRLEIEEIDYRLHDEIGSVITSLAPRAVGKEISLENEIGEDVPETVHGDPNRVRQVLINLVGNAVKFTHQGGVVLKSAVTETARGERLRFEIVDTGIGMDEETIAKLFSKFSQADASTTREYGGTGLGLAISHQLVELMGGEIGVDSEPGKGSTFWFDLPLVAASGPVTGRDTTLVKHFESNRPLNILVAEDNRINQVLLRRTLSDIGHACYIVENGAEAVEAAKSGDFELVLMDVRMPVMDGPEATRRIRRLDPPLCDIPIVACTADVTVEHKSQYLEAGMQDCVMKPIDRGELFSTIDRVLGENIHSATMQSLPVLDAEEMPQPAGKTDPPQEEADNEIEDFLERLRGEIGS
jgi:PAS domain S-box-containing protein